MENNWSFEFIAKNENGARARITQNHKPLSFKEVLELWKTSNAFIGFYTQSLLKLGFEGLFWEHPAVDKQLLHLPYEVMILRTAGFDKLKVNTAAFSDHIHADENAVTFYNLGKNARLIVPTLKATPETYKQLGSFITDADDQQVYDLFHLVSSEFLKRLEATDQPIWLNTAGLGVIWLHIRLDSRPKYYKIKAYKNPDFLKKKA